MCNQIGSIQLSFIIHNKVTVKLKGVGVCSTISRRIWAVPWMGMKVTTWYSLSSTVIIAGGKVKVNSVDAQVVGSTVINILK